jgi:hypothetical protein
VVNDGSADHAAEVLGARGGVPSCACGHLEKPRLRRLSHRILTATKDLVFYTDGDAQYGPREMESLFAVWGEERLRERGQDRPFRSAHRDHRRVYTVRAFGFRIISDVI